MAKERMLASPVWPGIIAPVGLTLLLAVAAWLFNAKVETDQKEADSSALALERRARRLAGEISSEARSVASAMMASRLAVRNTQERNLRLEAKGVLDAAHRLLAVSLDQARKKTVTRREVGPFPPELEAVRSFLEISSSDLSPDPALSALRAVSPELSALLPSGCSLAVIEDNARELLAVGGGVPMENSIAVAINREFIFDDGRSSRIWALRVEIISPYAQPLPGAAELAEYLTSALAYIRVDGVVWRGWLLGDGGEVTASFPVQAAKAPSFSQEQRVEDNLLYVDMPGEWVEIDGRRLLWLERPVKTPGLDFTPAVAVAIARPDSPLALSEEFWKDNRWSATLGCLAILSLAGWVWFAVTFVSSCRAAAVETALAPRTRLVRDGGAARVIPEVQGVIVADIHADGKVSVQPPPATQVAPPMPSGSAARLQAIHRGPKKTEGSRVLDQARSQLLRQLADKVRPPVAGSRPESGVSHPIRFKM
ncbi:MAG: hypothetical protein FWG74_01600 [Planctomycetes bacterium]|nr:hypothetical protein [Planctomycetota bacterium]